MRIFFVIAFSAILFSSCKNSSAKSETQSVESEATQPAAEAVENKVTLTDLQPLEAFVGKKPSEFQMFEKFNLYPRLEKMMGKEAFEEFKKDWNNESVLKKDVEIMWVTGCRADVCKANNYFLVLDLLDNTINVYNYKHERGKTYEERAVIGMPYKMTDEFIAYRKAQGL